MRIVLWVCCILAGAIASLWLFADTLRWLLDAWQTDPNYSHGLLAPFIAAFFFWRARAAFRGSARQPSAWGLGLLAGALGLHLLATPWRIYPLSALALIGALAAGVWLLWGVPALRASAYAFISLLLMIPLPFIDRLSPMLEAFTARIAGGFVSLLDAQVVITGSQVQLPTAAFEIGAACSGLRSLASLLTLAVVFSGIVAGPRWGKLLIVCAAAPIAILANLVRVSSILQIAQAFGAGAGLAYYHDYSSPVLFLSAFALLILFARSVHCAELRLEG